MVNNVNSTMPTPFANNSARVFGNRLAKLNLPTNFSTPNARSGVEVNISEQAQKLFMQMQQGNDLTSRLKAFVEYDGNLTPQTDIDLSIFSQEAMTFLSQSSLFFGTDWTADDIVMAELGYQLIGAFNFDTDDTHNFIALANRYSELRQALTEEFTGEELENRLNALSQAFDLSVEIQAHHRSIQTSIALRVERNRITMHNQMIQQGVQSPFFEGGKIEIDQNEFNRIHEMLTAGVRDAVGRFAQLTRQFVLENGLLNTAQDRENLEAFLQSAERPSGGLGLNDLNSITGILRSDFPNGRDNTTLNPIARRNETMFTELLKALPHLNQ